MDDDDLTPEEFRNLIASGEAADISPDPSPTIITEYYPDARLVTAHGGGVSAAPPVVLTGQGGLVPALAG